MSPPFSEKKGLVISPPTPTPSIKQVEMEKVARDIAVLLPLWWDASSLLISLPICHSLFINSGWNVEAKDFKFTDIFLLLK